MDGEGTGTGRWSESFLGEPEEGWGVKGLERYVLHGESGAICNHTVHHEITLCRERKRDCRRGILKAIKI